MDTIKVNNIDISEYVTSLQYVYEIDEDEYVLGNAVSEQVNITLRNEDNQLSSLIDYPFIIGNKTYTVYEKPEKWTSTINLVLYDQMIKTSIYYNSSLAYPTTFSNQLDEIAQITGVEIDKTTLSAGLLNREVNQYDNTITIRDFLGYIAECDGKNVFIENDKIVFKYFGESTKSTNYCSDYELNELIEITRVLYEYGINVYEKGNETGNTLVLNPQNTYITEDDVTAIYNHYKDMQFYSFNKFKTFDVEDLNIGDFLTYNDIKILVLRIKRTVNGGEAKDSLELKGNFSIKNAENVVVKEDPSLKIRKIQTIVDNNTQTLNILAQEVDDAVEKVGELELSVDEISLQVSETSEQVYKFESGSGNIFDNTYQYISKDSESTEAISATDMPLGINMDFMQGKDICISVYIQVKNGIIGSLEGYVGAEFEVGFSDNSKETYAVRWYAGQSSFQYVLATGSVDFDQRIYAHYKLPDKEITSVSNLKTIINLNAEFAYVSNPKVEFGTYPTGYEFDVPYIRDNVVTLNRDYTLIQQQLNELSLQAVSMTQEITTIKGDVSEVTTRLQSAEIKLQPTNILLAVNEQLGADGDLHTSKFVLDKDGGHFSGGGLDISNNSGEQVFYADTEGNIVLKGTIYATNGEFSGTITWASIESADINITEDARIGNCLYLGSVTDKTTLRYISLNGSVPVSSSELNGDLLAFRNGVVELMGENEISISTDQGTTAIVLSDSKVNIYAPLGVYVNGNKVH